ncbi:hypothetical protein [Haloechinothrix sp. LS1_15]|uniref:hypothetical protein n=1 Tax=Haloechinothrix sp. LS1_15 TaxID=2652248 RepID=UPI00294435CC|nr:hypothetical protein [Haloechinothrix sp. LS1_15]MDV6011581.1 hypothetical protein [Haloechinothrix sp. LS1_15]
MRKSLRTSLVATGAATGLLALSACGSGITTFEDVTELASVASASAQEHSTAKFTMEMDMAGMTTTASGEGEFAGADSAMAMTMDTMGSETEMRLVDGVLYVKASNGGMGMGMGMGMSDDPDKPWVATSIEDSPFVDESMIEQNDPSHTLDALAESGEIVESDFDTELDGEAATYYLIEMDADKVIEQYVAELQPEIERGLGDVEFGTVPVELWIGENELPLKYTVDIGAVMASMAEHMGEHMPPGMAESSMTVTYSDWGEPVTVEAPPEDEVGEASEMPMGGLDELEELEELEGIEDLEDFEEMPN